MWGTRIILAAQPIPAVQSKQRCVPAQAVADPELRISHPSASRASKMGKIAMQGNTSRITPQGSCPLPHPMPVGQLHRRLHLAVTLNDDRIPCFAAASLHGRPAADEE